MVDTVGHPLDHKRPISELRVFRSARLAPNFQESAALDAGSHELAISGSTVGP